MFLYYFSYVPKALDEVAAVLEDAPMQWLPGYMTLACLEAASLEGAGMSDGPCVASARAFLAVGPPSRRPGSIQVPVRVEMRGPGAPFRSLEADLEAAELGPRMTQLTLRGSYRTMASPAAQQNPGLPHRIAEAAGKAFVELVATHLSGSTSDGAQPRWQGAGHPVPAFNV